MPTADILDLPPELKFKASAFTHSYNLARLIEMCPDAMSSGHKAALRFHPQSFKSQDEHWRRRQNDVIFEEDPNSHESRAYRNYLAANFDVLTHLPNR